MGRRESDRWQGRMILLACALNLGVAAGLTFAYFKIIRTLNHVMEIQVIRLPCGERV